MKKITLILLTTLLILTGCTAKDDNSKNAEKITIWAWDEAFNIHAAKKAKEMYGKDIDVEIVTMSQDDIVQKLNTSLSSNSIEGLPNIVLVEDYKIQGYLSSYPESFASLDDIIDESKFSDYKLAVTKKDGINYGVPFDSGVVALFYRTDIFQEAGYEAKDLEDLTWEQFLEIGKNVFEKTGKPLMTLDPSDIGQIRIMMQSAGAWYVGENETVNLIDNEELKNAIEIYKLIVDANITKTTSTWDEFVGALNNDEVASVTTGAWIASSIKNNDNHSGKWGIAPAPRMGNNIKSINRSNIGGSSWYVLDKVEGKELALDFLKETFASNLDLMNDLAAEINLVSTLTDAIGTENYKKEDTFFNNQLVMQHFSQWTSEIPGVNYGYNTYLIEEIVATHLMDYMNGTKSLDDVLQEAQTEAEGAIVR